MSQLQIQPDDLIATLEAQRNEAWNAAAKAGAAFSVALREIDAKDARIGELEVQREALRVELAKVRANDIPGECPRERADREIECCAPSRNNRLGQCLYPEKCRKSAHQGDLG